MTNSQLITIPRYQRRHGVVVSAYARRFVSRVTEELQREIVARYEAGETSTAIGRAMSIPGPTVLWWLEKLGVPRKQATFRFWPRVAKGAPAECWPLTGLRDGKGYGRFSFNGRTTGAHRVAFYLAHGRWPNVARHTCNNPPCCNPAHLLDGTIADNHRDMIQSKRGCWPARKGFVHPCAKLTEDDVANIRTLVGLTTRKNLERAFGVHKHTIASIVRNKSWRHV